MDFNERVNLGNLKFVLDNEEYYKQFLKEPTNKKKPFSFAILRSYYKRFEGELDPTTRVFYKQVDGGRYYADKSQSLQGCPRVIKSVISPNWWDLDLVNCHPTELSVICKRNSFECPSLDNYLESRDVILEDLMKVNPNQTRDSLKEVILGMPNGGHQYLNITNTEWLRNYGIEIEGMMAGVKNWFPKEYETGQKKKPDNPSGYAMSMILQRTETELMKPVINYLRSKNLITSNNLGVWCFDGFMFPKENCSIDEIETIHIPAIEKILLANGFPMKIKVKHLDNPPPLPLEKVEPKKEEVCSPIIYEWNGSILSGIKNDYYFPDFRKELEHMIFPDKERAIEFISKKIGRVVAFIENNQEVVRSVDRFTKTTSKILPLIWVKWVVQSKNGPVVFPCMLDASVDKQNVIKSPDVWFQVPKYTRMVMCMDRDRLPRGAYNSFTGFVAEVVESIDMTKFDRILNHIRETFADNNEEHYKYILTWMADMFQNPQKKKGIAILLQSQMGLGKGIFTRMFVEHLIGENYSTRLDGLMNLTSQFNSVVSNKLLISIDEIGYEEGRGASIDKLNSMITDNKIGVREMRENLKENICIESIRFISYTNHENSIQLNTGDRRWAVFQTNPIQKGNGKYFTNLTEQTYNQDCVNHFYTYLMGLKIDIDLLDIPLTDARKKLIRNTNSNSLRFLMEVIENNDLLEIIRVGENLYSTRDDFYQVYRNVMLNDGALLGRTSFFSSISNYIDISRKRLYGRESSQVWAIDIKTIRPPFKD